MFHSLQTAEASAWSYSKNKHPPRPRTREENIIFEAVEKIKIIVAPLDWGLGHATRCIPIIRELLKHDIEVIIAADLPANAQGKKQWQAGGRAAQLLKEEFPQLTCIYLKGYHVHYSSSITTALSIALQIPKIIFAVAREHSELKKIIKKYRPHAIISDNRYGLWSKKRQVHTVFITHQLMVKLPKMISFLETVLHKIILSFVKRYNECWIPDVDGEKNISGDLSHKYPLPPNAKYIGWLSRFYSENGAAEKKYDLLVMLSGAEPLRTELERKLTEQVKGTAHRTLMVRGVTEEQKQFSHQDNLIVVPYLNSKELSVTMHESDTIICRSGYSSLMDMAATGKKAVLIPTPGQTEQEYLAEELMKKKKCFSSSQEKFNLDEALKKSGNYKGWSEIKFETQVSKAVESLLKNLTEY